MALYAARRARGKVRLFGRAYQIALGCMGMSGAYGKTDDVQSIAVIHAALERGITLLDTGDLYGAGHNELLILAYSLVRLGTSYVDVYRRAHMPRFSGATCETIGATRGRAAS